MFFDEVQNVPGWERWVHRIQDTEDVEIYVTGIVLPLALARSVHGIAGAQHGRFVLAPNRQ
jgi:predicted AAA+ superfamily ATPase